MEFYFIGRPNISLLKLSLYKSFLSRDLSDKMIGYLTNGFLEKYKEMEIEMSNIEDFLDVTLEEVEEAKERAAEKTMLKDGRVCVCGHSSKRHTVTRGTWQCSANRASCACRENRPVIRVDNARIFLRKTVGSGALHALSQGMADALTPKTKKDKDGDDVFVPAQNIEWLIELKCDACGEDAERLIPVCINESGRIMDFSTPKSLLICRPCRENANG